GFIAVVDAVAIDVVEHLAPDCAKSEVPQVHAGPLLVRAERYHDRFRSGPWSDLDLDRVLADGESPAGIAAPFHGWIVLVFDEAGAADVVAAGGLGEEVEARVKRAVDVPVGGHLVARGVEDTQVGVEPRAEAGGVDVDADAVARAQSKPVQVHVKC